MRNALAFEHGDTTCASEPGVFCMFLFTKHFGTAPVCHLFDDQPLHEHTDGEFHGWLARCPKCVELFTGDRIVQKKDLL